jgi:hypothetical protein
MTRYFLMKDAGSVKVGLLGQAPTGQGGDRIYENLSIESKTIKISGPGNKNGSRKEL